MRSVLAGLYSEKPASASAIEYAFILAKFLIHVSPQYSVAVVQIIYIVNIIRIFFLKSKKNSVLLPFVRHFTTSQLSEIPSGHLCRTAGTQDGECEPEEAAGRPEETEHGIEEAER